MERLANDYMLRAQIFKVLNAHGIYPTECILLPGKISEPKYKVLTLDKAYFAKFSPCDCLSKCFTSNHILDYRYDGYCLLPIISENIEEITRQLNIFEWIKGTDLREYLRGATNSTYYEYGYRSGILLKWLHNVSAEQKNTSSFDLNKSIIKLCTYTIDKTTPLLRKDYWVHYIRNYMPILNRNINNSIVHFDYKPKNIVLSNNRLLIVDFDSSACADPWLDFSDKGLALYPKKQVFNKGIIDGYFNGVVPNDFWLYFKVLSVYGLLQCSFLNTNRNNTNYLEICEKYLWDSYDCFNNEIPKWYHYLF